MNANMTRYIIRTEGMACSMCEAHINNAVRNAFKVKSVTSSHKNGETVVITEQPIDVEQLGKVVSETGYKLIDILVEPYEKKGFFSFLKRS